MLSDANREIRAEIDRSVERRLRRSADAVAFDYLDQLVAMLEELHMRDHRMLPAEFDDRFQRLDLVLPAEVKRPHPWPVSIRRLIDACFDLQEQLLVRQARPAYSRPIGLAQAKDLGPATFLQ
jgi:hypothetical protein